MIDSFCQLHLVEFDWALSRSICYVINFYIPQIDQFQNSVDVNRR